LGLQLAVQGLGHISQLDHLGHAKMMLTCASHVKVGCAVALVNLLDQPACAVPPTVSPSSRNVGWPTPTGTPWPFLPQVPTPVSSFMSLPTIFTRLRSVGPLPISMAPLSGAPSLPFSIVNASVTLNTYLPEVMSTWPPPRLTQYTPFFTDAMISAG